MHDVAVIGGGPAGTAAAITLARAGKNVCLIEKGGKDRPKICGDGLMPDAQRVLERLGVIEQVRKECRKGKLAELHPPHGKPLRVPLSFYILPRARLDQILRDRAAEEGVDVQYDTDVTDVNHTHDSVEILTSKGSFSAAHAIIATGTNIALAQKLGIKVKTLASGAAIRGYQRINGKPDQITVFFQEGIMPGYAWIFPISETEANVGVGYAFDRAPSDKDLRKLLDKFVNSERAKEYLTGDLRDVRAWPLRAGMQFETAGVGKVLLAGENLDTTLHVTGEGVGKAMASGIIAAESIIAGGDIHATYQEKLSAIKRVHEGYFTLHKAAGKKGVERFLKSEFLTNAVVGVLNTRKGQRLIADVYDEKKSAAELSSRWRIMKNLLF